MDQTVFLWLMGCSHWASKPNQNHILAICIQRDFLGILIAIKHSY
ncbi:DUF4291 family protein [Acinetobacter sp.]|nr:DUF4291 family protein [Acinetobacter sp.]